MIEDIIFETKGSNQCEIKLQHSTGETTTLLFNSTFPLQAQEYYLKAIQLLQQEKPDLSPKDDLFGILDYSFRRLTGCMQRVQRKSQMLQPLLYWEFLSAL